MENLEPRPGPLATLRGLVERPAALLLLCALALILGLPFLRAGFQNDDFILSAAMGGERRFTGRGASAWELFDFADGDPARGRAKLELGVHPWWSDPAFKIRFCRPVTGATHLFDHEVLGNRPDLAHVHNLVWFLLGAAAAWLVYLEVLGSRGAAFAAAYLYIVAPQNTMVVGWISARNALLALAFAGSAFAAHLAWRRTGSNLALVASLALLGLGLFANEGSSALLALVLAQALAREEGPARTRALGVLPCLLLLAAWWLWYRAHGYGVAGSGLYLAPEPARAFFWDQLARRYTTFLAIALGVGLNADLTFASAPAARDRMILIAFLAIVWVAVAIAPLVRRDRQLRFWLIALLVGALPCCLGNPGDRILGLCLVATPGFVVRLLQLAVAPPGLPGDLDRAPRAWRLAWHGLALYLLIRSFLVNPLLRPIYWETFVANARRGEGSVLKGALAERDLRGLCLVFVNPPFIPVVEWCPSWLTWHGRALPDRMRMLFPGTYAMAISRLDALRFRVEVEGRILEQLHFERSSSKPFTPGETIDLGDVVYRVEEVAPDGSPLAVTLTFTAPPDADPYLWLEWTGDRYRVFTLPAPGATVRLPVAASRTDLLAEQGWLGSLMARLCGSP